MKITGKVHCFFEQSGTFKREFIKLGIPAEDYDIQNNFGETVGYQVVVPVDKKVRTIDADQTLLDQLSLDQVALDQVILKARDERKGASVVKSEASSQEKENIFTKVAKKTTSKKKSSKTKK